MRTSTYRIGLLVELLLNHRVGSFSLSSLPTQHVSRNKIKDAEEVLPTDLVKPSSVDRRQFVHSSALSTFAAATSPIFSPDVANGTPVLVPERQGNLVKLIDPDTYSALAYIPPLSQSKSKSKSKPPPLLIVLHGAGENERDVWNLADIQGEHAGLVPSLIASGNAPPVLTDNFVVVCPYCGQGKRSFYEEPRQKLLKFVSWVCSDAGKQAGCPEVDPDQVFLLGFSDGATVAVELLTTGRFKAGVVAAYGFTGKLPLTAVDRLTNVPMWVFHSADDVIFPVKCSDKLVETMRTVNNKDIIRYSRFKEDQEGFTGAVRGHSTGITASRTPEMYEWMLSI